MWRKSDRDDSSLKKESVHQYVTLHIHMTYFSVILQTDLYQAYVIAASLTRGAG